METANFDNGSKWQNLSAGFYLRILNSYDICYCSNQDFALAAKSVRMRKICREEIRPLPKANF